MKKLLKKVLTDKSARDKRAVKQFALTNTASTIGWDVS